MLSDYSAIRLLLENERDTYILSSIITTSHYVDLYTTPIYQRTRRGFRMLVIHNRFNNTEAYPSTHDRCVAFTKPLPYSIKELLTYLYDKIESN